MSIFTTTTRTKLAEYLPEFIRQRPNNEKNEDGTPKYTDAQWFEEVVKRDIIRMLKAGYKQLQEDAHTDKEFIIE